MKQEISSLIVGLIIIINNNNYLNVNGLRLRNFEQLHSKLSSTTEDCDINTLDICSIAAYKSYFENLNTIGICDSTILIHNALVNCFLLCQPPGTAESNLNSCITASGGEARYVPTADGTPCNATCLQLYGTNTTTTTTTEAPTFDNTNTTTEAPTTEATPPPTQDLQICFNEPEQINCIQNITLAFQAANATNPCDAMVQLQIDNVQCLLPCYPAGYLGQYTASCESIYPNGIPVIGDGIPEGCVLSCSDVYPSA